MLGQLIKFSAISLIAISTSAMAADVEQVAPPYDWTGAFVGVQAGYGWGNADQTWAIALPVSIVDDDLDVEGFFGGLHAGYNYQINSFVLGIVGDIELSNLDGDDDDPDFPADDINGMESDFAASIRGRLGFAFDRALIYGTGGVSFLEGEGTIDDPGAGDESVDISFMGWTIGAGAEYALTDSISAGVEYRFTDYGKETKFYPLNGYFDEYDLEVHDIRGTLSFHF